MDIKRADSKGRVTVGEQGEHYWSERREDGAIVLHPLSVPSIPPFDAAALRALYWDPSALGPRPDRVLINSVIGGSAVDNAKWVSRIANDLRIPVVIDATGVGAGIAQVLEPLVERGVLKRYRGGPAGEQVE